MDSKVRSVWYRWVDGPEERRHQPGAPGGWDQILRPTACGTMADWTTVTRRDEIVSCPGCQGVRRGQ